MIVCGDPWEIEMNLSWQDIAVVLIVAVAAASIIRHLGRRIRSRRSGGCESCRGCEQAAAGSESTLIDLR